MEFLNGRKKNKYGLSKVVFSVKIYCNQHQASIVTAVSLLVQLLFYYENLSKSEIEGYKGAPIKCSTPSLS